MRKKSLREPLIPVERDDTIRKYIVSLLEEHIMSAKEVSAIVRIPEREVYGHLEHIRRTLHQANQHLHVEPAACGKCGFVFHKRDRLSKPGKCPLCHGQLITPPLFRITGKEK